MGLRRSSVLVAFVAVSLSQFSALPPARGAISVNGEVDPANPEQWTRFTTAYIGKTADGTVMVDNGSFLLSGDTFLGLGNGVSGTASVVGADAKWTSSRLFVGDSGSGSLRIEGGGRINAGSSYLGHGPSSEGSALVTGAGSMWSPLTLCVGEYGTGVLHIEGGGQVTNTNSYLGLESGSTGTATVTGAGSKWSNSADLCVGGAGNGTLTVADGGEVTSKTLFASLSDLRGNGTITANGAVLDADLRFDSTHGFQQVFGFGSGGTFTLTLDGSGSLGAGNQGTGSLTIADGFTVSGNFGYLGYNAGSTGTALITGRGSKWINSGDVVVGRYGSGTLTVADGGEVTARALYASLSDLQGNGVIAVKGAVLDADVRFDSSHGLQQSFTFGSGGALLLNLDGSASVGVGFRDSGTLTIADGATVNCTNGFLGYNTGSSGTATVTGSGSKWVASSAVRVGFSGAGAIEIEAGGQVNSTNGSLGYDNGSTGIATITGDGSMWTYSEALRVGSFGRGELRIEERGQVSGTSANVGYEIGSSGSATITGDESMWTNSGGLYLGRYGTGELRVQGGGRVSSGFGNLGYETGSFGSAAITGTGSMWTNSGGLYIGRGGTGMFTVKAGGKASNSSCFMGFNLGSAGTATVTGAGSKWTNSGGLYVGDDGSGTLVITDGGVVNAKAVSINSKSSLAIDADRGSSLTIDSGSGTLTNNGKVRLLAAADVAPGTYEPIRAGTWSGTGIYQAIGGTWNVSTHEFVVGSVEQGLSGSPVSLNLASRQRALVTCDRPGNDPDWHAGASFLATTTSTPIEFTATAVSGQMLTDLENLIAPEQSVLCGWEFSTVGYTVDANHPAYLSFDVGAGFSRDDFTVWHHDGSTWTEFAPMDLTYDGEHYASFTVESFSGYAITAVPEPGTLALLSVLGLAGLMVLRRRK